jgi:acyl phosphate:glycerol-3-phosphate acyltransferase
MHGSVFNPPNLWCACQVILIIVACYSLGCITVGYYLVRWRTGQDIRRLGSGNLGAKNVSRILGRWGFVATFFGDFAKGMIAVALAIEANLPPWAVTLAMLAVVAGHNWPLQLRFHGGKGISASLGAVMLYNRIAITCLVVLFIVIFALWRKFTLSGLLAYAMAPMVLWFMRPGPVVLVGMFLLAVEVIFAHRQNLRDEFLRLKPLDGQGPSNAL